MKFPFFASFVIFVLILQHNIRKGKKTEEQSEESFWQNEIAANHVRRRSLEDLEYVEFKAEPFYPLNLLGNPHSAEFLVKHPEVKDILSHFLLLENEKKVNLNEYTNTDLKFKYGVANLTLLSEYDTNYSELITLLQTYGSLLFHDGYENQAAFVLEYAVSIGSDISSTYMLLAKIYENGGQWEKIEELKKEAEKISTSRKSSIVRKLQEFGPCNG